MDLLVTADDRTGAFETAAALADCGAGPVPVHVWPDPPGAGSYVVVDLGSRHISPGAAADRAAGVPVVGRYAHKIDSTLRGNWAEELVGRQRVSGAPVLLVPSLPTLGRTCVNGVVLDHGRPVHQGSAGSDVRRRVTTSRPAESLRAAGATSVIDVLTPDAVESWLCDPSGIAIADASDHRTIDAIVARWAPRVDVALAGTSAVIGAAAQALGAHRPTETFVPRGGAVLVACGSVHPMARAQIVFAEHHGVPVTFLSDEIAARSLRSSSALVLATEIPIGDIDAPMAVAAVAGLARGVSELRSHVDLGAIVLIGGDTAAAVLGHRMATVFGSIDPGTAWAFEPGSDVPIITRAGGFGSDHALLELIRSTLRP